MRTITLFLTVLLMSFSNGSAQVQSPSSFLGYEPGERFTRHHDIVAYFKHVAEESPYVTWKQYGESYRHREALTRRISGAVFRVDLDDSHPLAYGLGTTYATLKRGTSAPGLLESGWNVGVVPEANALLGGWAGTEAKKEVAGSLMAGTKSVGQGQIVMFSDNPLFRGFSSNGHLLFSNAVFQAWIAR